MQIFVRLKSPGKRSDVLSRTPYEIPDDTRTLRALLTALVASETAAYRARQSDEGLLRCLAPEAIEDQAAEGRVSFGRVYSDAAPNAETAVAAAIQAWEDGLVRVFLNDEELTEPDAETEIAPGSELTILRLTFLAGRMW